MSTLELENIKHPDNSGDNIALASNGNVGIGTSSPASNYGFSKTVEIQGGVNAELSLSQTNNSKDWSFGVGNGNCYQQTNSGQNYSWYTGGVEKLRIQSGGGISFNGDTAAANALDDYQEGTFTPGILNGWGILNPTYATNAGFYTKVGNIVHVAFRITLSGGSTNANGLRLVGLPFTVGATTNVGTNLSGWFSTASGNVENVFLGLEANDVHPLFYYKNASGTATFLGTDAGTGFSMTFSGTYQTA